MTSHNYRLIPLEDAAAGMVLSDDVLDAHGNVLLRQGMSLTDTVISSLRRHHVATLCIVSADDSPDEQEDKETKHEQRLAALFRLPGTSEDATDLLKQLVHHYRLGDSRE